MISNRSVESSGQLQQRGLPQDTQSLCPECLAVLPAVLYERDDKVWMSKRCRDHGEFVELISPDVPFFLKMDRQWQWELPDVIDTSHRPPGEGCPNNCGLCPQHKSLPMLVNIDLTNRCNLRCPVCFANAAATGRVYELSYEQADEMMSKMFQPDRVPPPCIQFSGGEPTIHGDFLRIVRRARELGVAQIQAATNGLKFADDPAFAEAASEAGLNVVYLQFDGVSDDVYVKTRGRPLWQRKQRAVENISRAGMEICLVPTLIRNTNDHQIGDIFRFAVDNIDTVVGISWQPVAFTGRIDYEKRLAMRFTTADLARCLDEQTNGEVNMHRDWYPLSFVAPFSRLIQAITGEPTSTVSCHRHCGSGSYVVVDRFNKEYRPIPAFVDCEPLMRQMDKLAKQLNQRRWFKRLTLMHALHDLPKYFHADRALHGWDSKVLMEFMSSFVDFRELYPDNRARISELNRRDWRYILMVAMHFQDVYNYQIPRVQRCVIHYATPDGKFYPFCTYNCGPAFRDRVEAQFSRPLSQFAQSGPVQPTRTSARATTASRT